MIAKSENDEINSDYREIIRREFVLRRSREPFYSLRDFARDLGLTPPHLSGLFKNKKGLSADNAYQVAFELGLHGFSANRFYFLVLCKSARSVVKRNCAAQGLRRKGIADAADTIRRRYENV